VRPSLRLLSWAGALALAISLAIVAVLTATMSGEATGWGIPGTHLLWAFAFASVGALIARQRSRNPIGWLLLGSAIFAGLAGFTGFALSRVRSDLAAALWEVAWVPAVAGLVTSLALIPDGRLMSPRWRPWLWLPWFSVLLLGLVILGGDALAGWLVAAEAMLQISFLPMCVAVAVRFRRSRGRERQQLKWIAFAGGVIVVAAVTGELVVRFLFPGWYYTSTVVLSLAVLGVPVAIGMAILRRRLYDIDRIISRTVAYATVTAVLALSYVTVVFVLRLIFPGGSQVAVVSSTLAVAALFHPLRRRVQTEVDRRFNRARYDAASVVDAFTTRIRSEGGIESVSEDLLDVAHQTMEPTSASLWLRK
jgi:hypothetical protein